jgi:hypothetical protein
MAYTSDVLKIINDSQKESLKNQEITEENQLIFNNILE